MNIAYVHGVAKDPHIGRQLEAFKSYNIDRIRIFEKSDTDLRETALDQMLTHLRKGDTVYIESFATLAYNIVELLVIIDALTAKDVGFVSLKENIDTTTPKGKLQLAVFSVMYQFERECAKKHQGRYSSIIQYKPLGRPKKYFIDDNFIAVYHKWKAGDITAVKAMELANMKKVSFYKLVKEYEAQKNQAGI